MQDTGVRRLAQSRSGRLLLRWDTARYGLLAIFLLLRLRIVTGSVVFTSYDSASYRGNGDLVSFFGNAPRLWGVPLFYAPLGGDAARAYAQWAVGTLAWATLAMVLWSLLRQPAARILAAGGVLVLGLTSSVVSWDFAILSESLSVSLGVLTLALLLRWAATGSRASLIALSAAAFWWTFTRPDIRVFTIFLIAVFAWYAWRRRDRRTASLVTAGVLAFAVAWCTAILPSVNDTYQRYSAIGPDEGFMYQLRTQIWGDPQTRAVFTEKLGMPGCAAADAFLTDPAWHVEEFAAAYRSCPELVAWGEQHKATAMTEFAKAAPGTYLRMTEFLFGQTLAGAHYAQTPTVLPSRISRIAFPADDVVLVRVLLVLLLAVAAAVATGAGRTHRLLVPAMIILAGVCLISAESNVVFGVGEFKRFGIQEAIGVRLAIVVLFAAALDALLLRRRAARVGLESGHQPTDRESVDADRSTRGGVTSQG